MVDDKLFTVEEIDTARPEILALIARATDATSVMVGLQDSCRWIDDQTVVSEVDQFRRKLQSMVNVDVDMISRTIESYAKDNSLDVNIELRYVIDLLLGDLEDPEIMLKRIVSDLNRALQESIEF